MTAPLQTPAGGFDILGLMRMLLQGSRIGVGAANTFAPGAVPGDIGQALSGLTGLLGLGTGLMNRNPIQAASGAISAGSQAANLAGMPGLGSALGAASGPLNLATGIMNNNPASMASGAATTAGITAPAIASALGASVPAGLSSIVAPYAAILGMSLPGGLGDQLKDAERRANEMKEFGTALRDLPTTTEQQQGALAAHQGLGEDPSGLSDEALRALTGQTQQGILNWGPGGHALFQLQAGEPFAGIKGRDISGPQSLMQQAIPIAAKDYMREADAFAHRGLTLGGDPTTAMHGSIYDPAAQQQALNAPNPADMLKALGKQYGLTDEKINALLDAHRVGTEGGGAVEKFDIPDWTPGNYLNAFEAWVKNPDATRPLAPQSNVYAGPPPNDMSGQFTGGGA